MGEEKKLFLLDAFALIYRGYFAFAKNPRINSKGLDTSAIYGFTNSLVEVIKNAGYMGCIHPKGSSISSF